LSGFQKKDDSNGLNIYKVKGWDYAAMCEVFEEGVRLARESHTPALFHVEEVTQPQGHSTSGSHERYKSPERLQWERDFDGIKKMREWILDSALSSDEELARLESKAKLQVKDERTKAWEKYQQPIKKQVSKIIELSESLAANIPDKAKMIQQVSKGLSTNRDPMRRDVMSSLNAVLHAAGDNDAAFWARDYYNDLSKENELLYSSHLYNTGEKSALRISGTKAVIDDHAPTINGFEILNKYFDALFSNNPLVVAFGEDVGKIGDVNQGFSGLQAKYGEARIFDAGIRELTIIGQGIGLAMRGLRPIAEIQYLDYLLYGLEPLSDDAATLHFRTKGKQSCPLIVRTRGHRLEGIWHSGSPMGMVINSLRGMYVCVPRNMTQAVGMYNTLLKGNDPAIVIECLNGYRLKEKLISNLLDFRVPLGIPEVIRGGTDITIVSYGSVLRIIQDTANVLETQNISCEVIDVQTLLPFDTNHKILESLKKTNRILFVDEDVPGGATAFMFNKVIEEQGGYRYLDVAPRTLTAKEHRPSYGSDGDYFSKPNAEEIETVVRKMMKE
jgi:pyruvate/2-oxoglutarate/acetoin dehydrogenase E1 component